MEKIAIKVHDNAKQVLDYLIELGYNENGNSGNAPNNAYYYINPNNNNIRCSEKSSSYSHCTLLDSIEDHKQHVSNSKVDDKPKDIFIRCTTDNIPNVFEYLNNSKIRNHYGHPIGNFSDGDILITNDNKEYWIFATYSIIGSREEVIIQPTIKEPCDIPRDPKKVTYKCDGTKEHYDTIIGDLISRGGIKVKNLGNFNDKRNWIYLKISNDANSFIEWSSEIDINYYEGFITASRQDSIDIETLPSGKVVDTSKFLYKGDGTVRTMDLILDTLEGTGAKFNGTSRQPFYSDRALTSYVGISNDKIYWGKNRESWQKDRVLVPNPVSNLPISQGILTHDPSPKTKLYFKGDGTKETVDRILDYLGQTDKNDRQEYYNNAHRCFARTSWNVCHGEESSWISDGYVESYLPTGNIDRYIAFDPNIAIELTRIGKATLNTYINNLNSNQNGKDGTICKVQRPTPQIGQAVTRRGSSISSRRSKASIG